MKNINLNDLMLKVNRICFGDKFKKAFTEKFKYCPNGLTYHIREEEGIEFIPCIKNYGYESSVNNGISDFTDAYDFDIGNGNITQEQADFMYDYFKHYETEFYKAYMTGSYVY